MNSNTNFKDVKSPDEVKQQLEKQYGAVTNQLTTEVEVLGRVNVAEAGALEEQFVNRIEDEFKSEQLKRLREDNAARKNFSIAIFIITVIWMFLVLWIVFNCAKGGLHLSDAVLIALITTTTANVFGFFYLVVNYLFNKEKST